VEIAAIPANSEIKNLAVSVGDRRRTWPIRQVEKARDDLDGDKVTHKIDVSWNQNWTGGEQIRFYKMEGTTITIRIAINKSPRDGREGRGILVFTKTQ
jgi:hypothetical protein